MPKYKLCPRCELNYIPEDEDYCGVCKAELKIGPQLQFAVDDEDDEDKKLCPVCKNCYIPINEDMCESCAERAEYEDEKDIDMEQDEGWREFRRRRKGRNHRQGKQRRIALAQPA